MVIEEMAVLRQQGITVHGATIYDSIHPTYILTEQFYCPHFRNLLDAPAYLRLYRYMRREHITHLVSALEHANIIARSIGLFMAWGCFIGIFETGMADRKPLRYKVLDIILNLRTNVVIAVSDGVRESLLQYQPFYAHKTLVVANAVPVPTSLPLRTEGKVFTVLAVGSLRREKGFDILLDAFSLFIKNTAVDSHLIIIGKGILGHQLQKQAEALGIGARVQFLGFVPQEGVYEWYRRAHCFVLSSLSEGHPLVVLEALSQGTPTIATRVAGIVDMIENNVSGILVPIGSAKDIADALARFYASPMLREQLGRGGYMHVKQKFSFEGHIEHIREALAL